MIVLSGSGSLRVGFLYKIESRKGRIFWCKSRMAVCAGYYKAVKKVLRLTLTEF